MRPRSINVEEVLADFTLPSEDYSRIPAPLCRKPDLLIGSHVRLANVDLLLRPGEFKVTSCCVKCDRRPSRNQLLCNIEIGVAPASEKLAPFDCGFPDVRLAIPSPSVLI